jgi:hypothetical protein
MIKSLRETGSKGNIPHRHDPETGPQGNPGPRQVSASYRTASRRRNTGRRCDTGPCRVAGRRGGTSWPRATGRRGGTSRPGAGRRRNSSSGRPHGGVRRRPVSCNGSHGDSSLLTPRSAGILGASLVIAACTGVLTYLAMWRLATGLPTALLAAGAAFAGAIRLLDTIIA